MRLIVVRHGETIENSKNISMGQRGGNLSPKGTEQAKKLAERFKNRKFDAIYSSDLKRAVNTAHEILKYHPLKLNLDKRLRERFFGEQQGKLYPENWDWGNLPSDCETDAEICDRVKKFVDDILLKHENETVLLVCHGGIKMALVTIANRRPASDFQKAGIMENTAVSEFDIRKGGKYRIHLTNCAKHLN